MAPQSSVLAWRIPGMEEPAASGVAQSRTRLKRLSSSSRSSAWRQIQTRTASRVQLCATPWAAARQAPPSLREERRKIKKN